MKRSMPCSRQVDVILSDESSSSDIEVHDGPDVVQSTTTVKPDGSAREITSEDILIRRAKMYQEYMKHVPIPMHRGSVIPFNSWVGLGKSIKELYGQPLHYLTNIMLRQWDQLRFGSDGEHISLDTIIHPCKAEATVWLTEEIHRSTASPHHIAKLWRSDPMHQAFVDSIFPPLGSSS